MYIKKFKMLEVHHILSKLSYCTLAYLSLLRPEIATSSLA